MKNEKFYKANISITKCEDFLVLVSITYSQYKLYVISHNI